MGRPYVTLPRGAILYRAAPGIQNWHDASYDKMRECGDTGKTGAYFSTYPVLAIAMLLEYERDMPVGVFELKDDVELFVGKYSFREMDIADDQNINHCDPDILPLDLGIKGETKSDMEVFIANESDLDKLNLICAYDANVEALRPLKGTRLHPHDPILQRFDIIHPAQSA